MTAFRTLAVALLTLLAWSSIASSQQPTQMWQKLTNQPGVNTDTALMLTDGRVMMHEYNSTNWYALTPTVTGSYLNGTWKQLASMPSGYEPLYFASAVLPDGQVLVTGGYGNHGGLLSVVPAGLCFEKHDYSQTLKGIRVCLFETFLVAWRKPFNYERISSRFLRIIVPLCHNILSPGCQTAGALCDNWTGPRPRHGLFFPACRPDGFAAGRDRGNRPDADSALFKKVSSAARNFLFQHG